MKIAASSVAQQTRLLDRAQNAERPQSTDRFERSEGARGKERTERKDDCNCEYQPRMFPSSTQGRAKIEARFAEAAKELGIAPDKLEEFRDALGKAVSSTFDPTLNWGQNRKAVRSAIKDVLEDFGVDRSELKGKMKKLFARIGFIEAFGPQPPQTGPIAPSTPAGPAPVKPTPGPTTASNEPAQTPQPAATGETLATPYAPSAPATPVVTSNTLIPALPTGVFLDVDA